MTQGMVVKSGDGDTDVRIDCSIGDTGGSWYALLKWGNSS